MAFTGARSSSSSSSVTPATVTNAPHSLHSPDVPYTMTRCFENLGGLQSSYGECFEGDLMGALAAQEAPRKNYRRLRPIRISPSLTHINSLRKESENEAAMRLHEMFPSLTGEPREKKGVKTLQVHFLHKGDPPIPSTTSKEFQQNTSRETEAAVPSYSPCPEYVTSETELRCKRARATLRGDSGALDELAQSAEPVVQWHKLLWPFQKDCLAAIEAARSSRSNLVVMACGSGKTLVELATIFRASEPLHVLVAPTLELLWQIVENNFLRPRPYGPGSSTFAELAARYSLFAFCSYSARKLDLELRRISRIHSESEEASREYHATLTRRITFGTCIEDLHDFVQSGSPRKLLLVTYCSFEVVKNALTQMAANVGEMVFDEGHRAGGKLKRSAILNDWPEGTPRRLIFFTATPVKSDHFNMFRDCGDCVFNYGYTQALRDRVCRPVNVRLFPTLEVPEPGHDGRRRWIFENISRICLMEHQFKSWNILTYHRLSVSGDEEDGTAVSFADEDLFKEVFGSIQQTEFPSETRRFRDCRGALDIQMVALTMLTDNASSVLSKFEHPEGAHGRIRLIASCSMLNEGINTKSANMLVPISAAASWVKNIQRFGRIQRNIWGQAAEPSLLVLPIPATKPCIGNGVWDQSLAVERAVCRAVGMCTLRGIVAMKYQMFCAEQGRDLPKDFERAMHDVQDELYKIDSNRGDPEHPNAEKVVKEGGGGGGGGENGGYAANAMSYTGPVLLCPGLVNLFQLSQDGSSSLGVDFFEFEEVCEYLEQSASGAAPAWLSEEFVLKWFKLQRTHFHQLSPSRQAKLEAIPKWLDFCRATPWHLKSRQRLAPDLLLAQLKAYASECGLEKLYQPTTYPGGERERLLRSWCRHIRLEYNALNAKRGKCITSQVSRRRLSPHFISELEGIPGWRWNLRQPRGTYRRQASAKSSARARASAKQNPKSPMSVRRHLQTLGLPSGARGASVRKAYRALALKYHPDKNPGCKSSPKTFERIATAYNALRQAHLA
eukprot:TRINITY_DN76330_c0_g1_i1.p1 TRINITY_DN76330_c0_g1~~TRINITY_DN76330_c0_g1_i1.p1  ORF type:complete len:1011 (-),score=132.94 TRINITY_DN76330_c0_g1_i1:71-3103(-)